MFSLKSCRKSANLTQSDLSAKLGISKQLVSAWETGSARIDPKHREKLRQIFALSDEQVTEIIQSTGSASKNKDFIFARITDIYASLDRAERAELLAAAERIAERKEESK